MELGRITREWLEGLHPARFVAISSRISDIRRERTEARHRNLEQRRRAPASDGRYLRLERVKRSHRYTR